LDATEEGLVGFLAQKAQERWQDAQQPYLLSLVGPDLKALAVDYHAIIGLERLKTFAKRTEDSGGYKLVEHPRQKAKVGVVPAESEFAFPEDDMHRHSASAEQYLDSGNERERVVIGFLRALSRLSNEELDGVVIPTRVLVKLLGRK
jgi:hypothetical protein